MIGSRGTGKSSLTKLAAYVKNCEVSSNISSSGCDSVVVVNRATYWPVITKTDIERYLHHYWYRGQASSVTSGQVH